MTGKILFVLAAIIPFGFVIFALVHLARKTAGGSGPMKTAGWLTPR